MVNQPCLGTKGTSCQPAYGDVGAKLAPKVCPLLYMVAQSEVRKGKGMA